MTPSDPNDWNSGWHFAASADEVETGGNHRVRVENTDLTVSFDGAAYRATDGAREWPVMLVDGDIYVYAGDAAED